MHLEPIHARPPEVSVTRAVGIAFEGPNWGTNLLFAILLSFIPIVGPIVLAGWHMEILQRVVRGDPRTVPKLDLSDFVFWLERGVRPFVTNLAYSLLVVPVVLALWVVAFAGGILTAAGTQHPAGLLVIYPIVLLGIVTFSLFFQVLLNSAVTRTDLTENIEQGFAFGAVFRYARSTWLLVLGYGLLFGLIGIAATFVGLLACFIGIFPVAAALQVAVPHLRGQIYLVHLARGGEPIPLVPPKEIPAERPVATPTF